MRNPVNENPQSSNTEDRPPFFSRWVYWYILVIGELILFITLFILFTRMFS